MKITTGNTSYVHGAVYNKLTEEMKVLETGNDYDLVFDTVGLEGDYTMVKVRHASDHQKHHLGNIIDSLKDTLLKIRGNACTKRFSTDSRHKMIAFGSNFYPSKSKGI